MHRFIANYLIIFCLPLLFISSTIRFGVNNLSLYEYSVDKYDIHITTGIDKTELIGVYQHLIDFYNSLEDTPHIEVIRNGEPFTLFSENELMHLEDVKGLIRLDYIVQWSSLALLVIAGLVVRDREEWKQLTRSLFRGSVVTIALMVLLGIWALVGFDNLFIFFHMVSFNNNLWILDPNKDYLIMLFPGGFFNDVALWGFAAVIVEALVVGGAALIVMNSKQGTVKT